MRINSGKQLPSSAYIRSGKTRAPRSNPPEQTNINRKATRLLEACFRQAGINPQGLGTKEQAATKLLAKLQNEKNTDGRAGIDTSDPLSDALSVLADLIGALRGKMPGAF